MKLSQTLYALLLHLVPVRELHYINGADTLPAPLDPQQERQALEALSRGSTEARDLLITHNLRLVVYIAKKFETPSAGIEDMISIGTIGLIRSTISLITASLSSAFVIALPPYFTTTILSWYF